MKVEFKEVKQDFIPFEFTVKVETLEEARAWYAIFNHTQNLKLLDAQGGMGSKICAGLESKSGDSFLQVSGDRVIANGVTYDQYYK